MPKRNYGQEKRRKESERKARHQQKIERRQTRPQPPGTESAPAPDTTNEPAQS